MNEFDDERTIDEEEELGGQEDQQEEINDLNKEQDMPIEELLKLYGYTKPVGEGDQEEKADELVEGEEEDEAKNNDNSNTGGDIDDTTARKDEESDAENEMRSYSTLPPNKKPRSELAKFYESSVEGRSLRS